MEHSREVPGGFHVSLGGKSLVTALLSGSGGSVWCSPLSKLGVY